MRSLSCLSIVSSFYAHENVTKVVKVVLFLFVGLAGGVIAHVSVIND